MNRILLLLEHRENCRLLSDWLQPRYQVISPDGDDSSESLLLQPFDLCIIGARTLDQLWQAVQARRSAEQPVLLPFLLTTSRQDVKYVTRHLWQSIDELITQPIEKVELQARVEILLRSRQLSQRLQVCESETEQQVTARQQAEVGREQALSAQRYSDAQFRQMAETIPSVFWLLDLQSQQPLYLSPAYEAIWGRSRDTLYADFSQWIETVHPDDRERVQTAPARCLASGSQDEEYRIFRPDGSVRWIRDRGFVVHDAKGQPYRLAGVAEDITDRKQAEAEREQLLAREQSAREEAETANRIKDEFLAVLSHELRTPMNPILGWSSLLQRGKLDAAKTIQAIAAIDRNAKLQVQLIDDLLDISRILRGKLTLNTLPVHLSFVISAAIDTVRLAIDAKAIQLDLRLNPDVGQILGDVARLQQVMWNLLSNAVKFTPEGGQIEIRLEEVGGGQVDAWASGRVDSISSPIYPSTHLPIHPYAQLTVTDTGKGIHPNFLPYVFEHFRQEDGATTRKFGGLGLGLAISRQIVELHGGTVSADSPGEEQGATFTVRIPLMPQSVVASTLARSPKASADLSGIQILVVDDDADSRDFITFLLEQAGAIVTAAASGMDALQLFTQSPPDLLISDIGMPEMDGYMLMRHIRAMTVPYARNVPAIALTAYASEADEERACRVGFQKHLAKPIEPVASVTAIAELVQSYRDRLS